MRPLVKLPRTQRLEMISKTRNVNLLMNWLITPGAKKEKLAVISRAFRHLPPLLCGHDNLKVRLRRSRAECGHCGSFWDLDFASRPFTYDSNYPHHRHHHDPELGRAKVRTARRWLAVCGLSAKGKVICEVGFGGGSVIMDVAPEARVTIGIEAVSENLLQVERQGLPRLQVYHASRLPSELPERIDLWLFLDSFEHLEDPNSFATWVAHNSATNSEILVVSPRADSWSRNILGNWWPHKLEDHRFHWSRNGLIAFMAKLGFVHRFNFYPLKFISLAACWLHLIHKFGLSDAQTIPVNARFTFPFNIGQMGLVFRLER